MIFIIIKSMKCIFQLNYFLEQVLPHRSPTQFKKLIFRVARRK
jgi:hypothetical protein